MQKLIGLLVFSLLGGPLASTSALADGFKAKCIVTAGAAGGQKYVALKCAKLSRPGEYSITNTIWERKAREDYRKISRYAGRSFVCTMAATHTRADSGNLTQYLSMTDCK